MAALRNKYANHCQGCSHRRTVPSVFSSPGLSGHLPKPQTEVGGPLWYRAREHLFYLRYSVKAASDDPQTEVMCSSPTYNGLEFADLCLRLIPFPRGEVASYSNHLTKFPQYCLQRTEPANPGRTFTRLTAKETQPVTQEAGASEKKQTSSEEENRAPRFSESLGTRSCLYLGVGIKLCIFKFLSEQKLLFLSIKYPWCRHKYLYIPLWKQWEKYLGS